MKNSVILDTEKQLYRISYISNKFIPQSLIYFDNNVDGHVLYQGHVVTYWLRHYATSRKVAGLRTNEVNEFFFNLPNPSSSTRG
jgi:hypothetical protein